MTETDPWKGLLDPDEHIIWQGAPAPGVQLEWKGISDILSPIAFIGVGIYWLIHNDNAPLFVGLIALLPLGIGLYTLFGIHFQKAHQRRSTFYTLTSKRAFIAYKRRGMRKLDSYPIGPDSNLTIEEGALSNVWFETRQKVVRTEDSTKTVIVKIGFERLETGREVLEKFRLVQNTSAQIAASKSE